MSLRHKNSSTRSFHVFIPDKKLPSHQTKLPTPSEGLTGGKAVEPKTMMMSRSEPALQPQADMALDTILEQNKYVFSPFWPTRLALKNSLPYRLLFLSNRLPSAHFSFTPLNALVKMQCCSLFGSGSLSAMHSFCFNR
jgi:hypothetical protein